MKPPRGLTADEAAAWARLAATVAPLRRPAADAASSARAVPATTEPEHGGGACKLGASPVRGLRKVRANPPESPPAPGLDSHWDRRFARGGIAPDFTLDLHGHTLEQAHARFEAGLAQAKAMGARVVLVIAGKPRPAEAADRGSQRGAIRAKLLDWLAAGPHGRDVAAVRGAHRRHGGDGALYLVLKRPGAV